MMSSTANLFDAGLRASSLEAYCAEESIRPLFLQGDSLAVLKTLPSASMDCCMTSPPYWGHRQYQAAGIGLEENFQDYISNLCIILLEVRRVLKATGSLWLNVGDTYQNKQLLGIPWRVALYLTDQQGWILRNHVVWHKVKGGPDNATDKLRNVHEPVFHFVKSQKYFYDVSAIRSTPQTAKVVNGAVVSATGVSGVRYRRQIELSTALSEIEKQAAFLALEHMLLEIRAAKLADFRMIIRGQQRTTHSDSEQVSGRAKELAEKGFYFLKYHPDGSKPKDVWDIMPEDTQKRDGHYAPYPEDLCKIPILATCPPDGIVLDPFCGTGTTNVVAFRLGRKSVGIDISAEYLRSAEERCHLLI
jgi:DNA modification methylase